MSIDTIGDFLTIIRNGIMASKVSVKAPYSRLRHEIATILLNEGFINTIEVQEVDDRKYISIGLRYVDGESVIHEITRLSRPGRRAYARAHELKPVIGGLGISILTTSRGLMTNKGAKASGVGGEILCTVW